MAINGGLLEKELMQMMNKPWTIAGASGILFVVLFVIGVMVSGDVPMYDEEGDEIAAWFADNGDQYLVGDFLTGLAFILFYFPFLVGLYAKLRAAEGEPSIFSRVALIGGILFPVAGLVSGISIAALALLEGEVSAEVASFAAATSYHAFVGANALQAILLGAAAIVIIRTGVLWNWLGWLAGALALAAIVASASSIENNPEGVLSVIGIITFLGFGIWILATSVALLRTREPVTSAAM
jgi:hypothetical protein